MELKLYEGEYRLCEIVWENETINSSELVRLCEERLMWKKSTTYTVLRRLIKKGILKNVNAMVTSLVTRDEVREAESRDVIERNFEGSLPKFIAAFTNNTKLSKEEVDEIQRMIDHYREG